MRTFVAKSNTYKKNWYIVDASNKILGRFASKIAVILRGKHKPEYTPHVDTGDYVIVLNASKIIVTGKKYYNKIYYHHTGYIGGIKKTNFKTIFQHSPEKVIKMSIRGMLPKGPLGKIMFNKLKVYSNEHHNHIAQRPKFINL